MKPKVISVLVLIVLFLVFLVQNTQVVTLRLYFWKISMSQIILIPLVLILGFALGYGVAKMAGKNGSSKGSRKL
jgi:uncharacterized integral membrane protein